MGERKGDHEGWASCEREREEAKIKRTKIEKVEGV